MSDLKQTAMSDGRTQKEPSYKKLSLKYVKYIEFYYFRHKNEHLSLAPF